MHRMGHGTMRAALIYQHATGERDREIADALQFRIERELKEMGPIEGPGLAVDRSSLGLSPKKGEMTRDFTVERVTKIEPHDQLGRNLRDYPSRLGCACWSDLLAPPGTVIDSGLGPAKGPACSCCSICCLLAPVS
jgi:hypothetical protein